MTTAAGRSVVQLKNKLHTEITKHSCIYAASKTCVFNCIANSWSPIGPISAIKDCNVKCSDLPPIIVSLCMQTRMKLTDQTLWLFTLSLIEVVWDPNYELKLSLRYNPIDYQNNRSFIWLWSLRKRHKCAQTCWNILIDISKLVD